MSTIRSVPRTPQAITAVLLLVALVACWCAYAPGITGSLYFDDVGHLDGIAFVHDSSSGLRYIMSGTAGPFGRPLALASFVPQAYAWPDSPSVLLRTNILIHLLNGVLVTWFLYVLGISRRQTDEQSAIVGVASGAVWMLMPLLASSSLLIIQRMTTLSATFVLLGAIAYLYARRAIEQRPILALAGMTVGLVCGATLGALAKENGVLLILFILATEATLLHRPMSIRRVLWRSWFAAVLLVPATLLLAYLATRLPYAETVILNRDFNGFERLITEAGILWKYLYLAYFPNLPSLGPFHDDYQVQRSLLDSTSLLAVIGWIAVVATAIVMRRKLPLLGFAVAWYLLGHLLESTSIPLELYFEHRNYLPLIGPTYALMASILYSKSKLRRLAVAGAAIYCVVLSGVLFSVTSLWGSPAIAADMWYIYRPASIRAAQRLAGQMEMEGDPNTARKVIREVREHHPDAHYLDFKDFLISCQIERQVDYTDTIRSLEHKLQTTTFSYATMEMLRVSYQLAQKGKCGLDDQAVYRLVYSVLDNPRYGSVKHEVHMVLAQVAIEAGNLDLTIAHIEQALRLNPSPGILALSAEMLSKVGIPDAYERVISEARRWTPSHPFREMLWEEQISRLEELHRRSKKDWNPAQEKPN